MNSNNQSDVKQPYKMPLLETQGRYAVVTGSFGGDFLPDLTNEFGSDFLDQPNQE